MKKLLCAVIAAVSVFTLLSPAYAAKLEGNISGWGASFMAYPDGVPIDMEKTGMSLTRDSDKVADGMASLHIYIENQMDNLNIQASQNVTALEFGKTYKISGKFNIPGGGWRYRLMFGNTQLVALGDIVGGYNDWYDAEYVFKYTDASTEFRIQSCGAGSLYADNVSIKEVLYDDDGETVIGYGEELLKNGGFEEDLDVTPPGEVSGVMVENGDESAHISWINPKDTDFAGVNVYYITGGKSVLVCSTAENSCMLEGLENDVEYTYLLQTFDKDLNCSKGVSAQVVPIAAAMKYKAPVFSIGGKEVSALAAGRLTADMQFKNNRMSDDYSVELILVLTKDGALYEMSSGYATIPTANSGYTTVTAEIDVPDEEGMQAQLYVWDSITGMEALGDYYVLK